MQLDGAAQPRRWATRPTLRLKPGMFVSATIRAGLLASGNLAPTGVEGKWTCLMHPQVLDAQGGPCPVCKRTLTQIPPIGAAKPEDELVLAIPATAVLDSGIRKLAYIERASGEYIPAELKLGSRAGDFYPVLAGLKEGDRVAVRGNFLLDSQFQISGLPSLFYYWARSRVIERMNVAQQRLPTGVVPVIGPDATALAQVFWFTLEGEGFDLAELRSIQDWYLRYQLNAVEGVSEVASISGFVKQYQIDVHPDKLRAHRVSLMDVTMAVQKANSTLARRSSRRTGSSFSSAPSAPSSRSRTWKRS